MGYTRISLATDDSLGHGPKLALNLYNQRQTTDASVRALQDEVGYNANDPEHCPHLQQFRPDCCIRIVVDCEFVSILSFTLNPYQDKFPALIWLPTARNNCLVFHLLNGHTRREFIQERCASLVQALEELRERRSALSADAVDQDLKKEIRAVKTKLSEIGEWGAEVYDHRAFPLIIHGRTRLTLQ